MIDLGNVTMEEVAVMSADQLSELVALIGGRLLEISRDIAPVEAQYRQLRSEAAYLKEAKSSAQSVLRMHRLALGE